MFAIFRKNGFAEQDISFEEEGFEYYTSKRVAEDIADELTEIWNESDAIGHPWYGSKFYVETVSDSYIKNKYQKWAIQRACAEMA